MKIEEADPQEDPVVETTQNKKEDKSLEDKAPEETSEAEEDVSSSAKELFSGYKLITVDEGDVSGDREANVVVDIGYGDREYWAFTNE